MASTVVRSNQRLDRTRTAITFSNTETAVGGSETTVLDKFDCALYNRYAIQIFAGNSTASTVKVFGSLKETPGSEGGADWTQIGDTISVGGDSNALKAISTTPIRHLCVQADGSGALLTVIVYAEQV